MSHLPAARGAGAEQAHRRGPHPGPEYAAFFGVMGATTAMIFSGERRAGPGAGDPRGTAARRRPGRG